MSFTKNLLTNNYTMLQAKAIDVLLSLAFIYMLFSIAVSGIYELYQSLYNRRGRFLKKVLTDVLNDPHNNNFADELYRHPLVDSVKETRKVFPSGLSSNHFAVAITDILQYRSRNKSLRFNHETKKYDVLEDAIYDTLSPFEKLKNGIETLNDGPFKRIAETWIFDISEGLDKNLAIEKAIANIEGWFNTYMERTGGWFKRDLRTRMIVLGTVVSVVFNVNSIILVEYLWKEDAQREIIVQTAMNYVETTDSLNKIQALDTASNISQDSLVKKHLVAAKEAGKIIEELNLPLGWESFYDYKESFFEVKNKANESFWGYLKFGLFALLGWLCTGFAISFGADFWYNALKKLIDTKKTLKESRK